MNLNKPNRWFDGLKEPHRGGIFLIIVMPLIFLASMVPEIGIPVIMLILLYRGIYLYS